MSATEEIENLKSLVSQNAALTDSIVTVYMQLKAAPTVAEKQVILPQLVALLNDFGVMAEKIKDSTIKIFTSSPTTQDINTFKEQMGLYKAAGEKVKAALRR